jgi:hypothetical protein
VNVPSNESDPTEVEADQVAMAETEADQVSTAEAVADPAATVEAAPDYTCGTFILRSMPVRIYI